MLSDAVVAPLITGGLGLLGTLVTASIDWAKDRKASAQRQHLLEEEIKRLTFWETWLKIQTSAVTSESELAEEAAARGFPFFLHAGLRPVLQRRQQKGCRYAGRVPLVCRSLRYAYRIAGHPTDRDLVDDRRLPRL